MTIGEVIVAYRKEHGLSQREFAKQANVSNGYISMLENNENPKTGQPIQPTLPIMKSLASAMGISLHSLMKQADDTVVDVGEPEVFAPTVSALTDEERMLIYCWRQATPEIRENVAFALRSYGMPKPKAEEEDYSTSAGA